MKIIKRMFYNAQVQQSKVETFLCFVKFIIMQMKNLRH
jgi:hypothetical protein